MNVPRFGLAASQLVMSTQAVSGQTAMVDASTSTGAEKSKQYYLNRTSIFGPDDRGGAMAWWAAIEIDELRRGLR